MGLKVRAHLVLVSFISQAQSKHICLFSYLVLIYTLHASFQRNDKVLKVVWFHVMPTPKAQD